MEENQHVTTGEKKLILIETKKKEIFRGLYIFLLITFVVLFLRIMLRIFGANPQSFFAGFIYVLSTLFLLPFFNIFPQFQDIPIEGQHTFDSPALTAIFCYTIVVFLIIGVIHIGSKILKTERQVDEVVRKDHPVDTKIVNELVK